MLDVIRVWDWEAAFAKLKPEIFHTLILRILRFNNTLYWTASMKPVLPPSVDIGNRWYNEHLVYTHVPNGFLTLDATKGQIIDIWRHGSNAFKSAYTYDAKRCTIRIVLIAIIGIVGGIVAVNDGIADAKKIVLGPYKHNRLE